MQKMVMVTVFDKAIGAYMRPWFALTDAQAVRMFADELLEEGSPVNKHPEDYALFKIGTFSDDGKLEVVEPICLARAHEMFNSEVLKEVAVNA